MFRMFGLLAGFGLLLLLVKGVFFFLPLLAILFFFRLIIGGFGPFGYRRAYAFSPGRHRYGRRGGPRSYYWQAQRSGDCRSYGSRYDDQMPSQQNTTSERYAATGPTVRL